MYLLALVIYIYQLISDGFVVAMAYIVMVHIVMAYIAMAYTVMACIAMAYTVMGYVVIA